MGRNKKRTKGKTRPSSSRHSAELLSSAGAAAPPPGLVGFQNYPLETSGLHVPAGQQGEEGNGNASVIAKTMLKKDVVTKLKGIQEFISFCADNEGAAQFLPYFPRIYNKLAMETDLRVREAIQKGLEMYIPTLKKDIAAPCLKNIMPTWLFAQCDPCAGVASAAQSAFLKSFPEEKQSDAVMFCRSEILKAIKDNICQVTESSLSESGGLAEDVRQEKYELILICSVRGLKLFVSLLSEEKQKAQVIQPISAIVRDKRFWAHSESKVIKVCAAWYEVLHILTSEMPEVFQETKEDLISVVMSSLWKGDSQVVASIWGCAIQVMSTFENWWHVIDTPNVIVSSLLKFLCSGGYGNAAVVYPMLPSFLCQLTKGDIVQFNFCMEFFSSIRKSLFLPKMKTSPKECDIVIKAFVDCFKIFCRILIKKFNSSSYVTELLDKQLIPLIHSSLTPEGRHIAVSSLYSLLGLYLRELEIYDKECVNNESPYHSILTYIWENMSSEIQQHLDAELGKNRKDVGILILLFHSLHHPREYLNASERKARICFNTKTSDVSSFLFKYTVAFCGHLCTEIQRNLQPCCLELCTEIMSEVTCTQLFCNLLEALHVPVGHGKEAPFIFFKIVIMEWIKRASTCGDEVSLDWITDIIIRICFSVRPESAVRILETCSVIEYQKIFQRLVVKVIMSRECREQVVFHLWFHSPIFASVFKILTVRLVRKLVYLRLNLDGPEAALCIKSLIVCFGDAGSEKPEIPWAPIKKILNYFSHILSDEQVVNCVLQGGYNIIDFISDSIGKLFFQTYTSLNYPETTRFLFKVFKLSLEWPKLTFSECHDERRQLEYIWETSISCLVKDESDLNESNFLFMAADHLHDLLLKEMSKEMQKHVIEVAFFFLAKVEAVYSDLPLSTCESVLILLLKRILPSSKEWQEARSGLHLGTVMPVLKGDWFYPFLNDDLLPVCSVTVPPFLCIADRVADFVEGVWDFIAVNCSPEIETVYDKLLCSEHLPHVLWSVCYAENLNFFKDQDDMEPIVFSNLCEHFSDLMERCNICQLVSALSVLLLQDHYTWAVPFEKVLQAAQRETSRPLDYCNTFYFSYRGWKHNYLTVTQLCLKYSVKESIVDFLNSMDEDIFDLDYKEIPQCDKDFCAVVSQLARCLQQHGLHFAPSTVQKKVVLIMEKLARSEWFHEYNHDRDALLATCFRGIAAGVIKDVRNEMSRDLWFLIMKITVNWFQRSVTVADLAFTNATCLVFVQQTCELITLISKVTQEGSEDKADTRVNDHWKKLFESDISKHLLKLFLHFAGNIAELSQTSDALESVMFAITQALEYLSTNQLFEAVLFIRSGPPCSDLPERIDSAYKLLYELPQYLKSKSVCVQFGIHFILKKLLALLPRIDPRQRSYDEDENIFKSPLVEFLTHTNEVIEVLLDDVKPTDSSIIEPFTDDFTYCMANLLAWHIFLEYISASVVEERSVYVSCLGESEMLFSMLLNVIRLRPDNAALYAGYISKKFSEYGGSKVDLCDMPPICSLGTPCLEHLQQVACSVYVSALKKIPALVRTWWNNLDKKTADVIEKFTSENISKILISNEIDAINAHKDQFNMMVDAYASSRQVVATYTLDDATIELSIKIPPNYPLGPVQASSKKRNIVDSNQWRAWMFQVVTFLNYHNGSIKDALLVWKRNLDKKFEGVEECMICYFILHSSSCTLPNKTCRMCKKKFHGSCLFKWFKSSNSCSCPGCRNDF